MKAKTFLIVVAAEAADQVCLRSCLEGEDPVFRGQLSYEKCTDQCAAKVPAWFACLNVNEDKFKNNKLTLWRCDAADGPKWEVQPEGCTTNCTLRNVAASACLDYPLQMNECGSGSAVWNLENDLVSHGTTGQCMKFDAFGDAQNNHLSNGWLGGVSMSDDCSDAEWGRWKWDPATGEIMNSKAQVDMEYLNYWGEGFVPPKKNWAEWLNTMHYWRNQKLGQSAVGTNFNNYDSVRTQQSSGTYVTVQTMIHDRNLFDPIKMEWTADKYLSDLDERFGGVDQVLIWAGYPNVGVDTRSNFDLMEDLPGRTKGAVQALKKAQPGLMVQLPYKPWDILTNGLGENDPERMAELLADSGADGMNMDTMSSTHDALKDLFFPVTDFYDAAERAGVKNPTIEPEKGAGGLYLLNITNQGWMYDLTTCYSCLHNNIFTPAVSTQKTLQRRNMPHICGRWAKQRSEEILTSYFNAVGYTAWENIWGVWNGFNERDGQLLKRATQILRHFHPLLADPNVAWLPHYPLKAATSNHVHSSKFVGREKELWLFINADTHTKVAHLQVPGSAHDFYDMYSGQKLDVNQSKKCMVKTCIGKHGSTEVTQVSVEARGVSAVLRVPKGELSANDEEFMHKMRVLTSRPLSHYSNTWGPVEEQSIVAHEPKVNDPKKRTRSYRHKTVAVKGSKHFEFRIRGTMIEGFASKDNAPVLDDWRGVDVQYPWENMPNKFHKPHVLEIDDLLVDKFPITNKAFSRFLKQSSYKPSDTGNFLRHWDKHGCTGVDCVMPKAIAHLPVVNVGIEDARAYCAFHGQRLPHEWEWQYVAQGGNPDQVYPWGQEWQADKMPKTHDDASTFEMTPVGQFPQGASKDGVEDLIGLIYHWTDEYTDAHTRRAVLRGGPAFQPQGADKRRYQPWYFPGLDGDWADGAPWDPPYTIERKNYASLLNLTAHGNYLMMTPTLDRAGTIGFRCVQEVHESQPIV